MANIINISQDDLARYIMKILSSSTLSRIMKDCTNLGKRSYIYDCFATCLTQYALATGDLNSDNITELEEGFLANKDILNENYSFNNGKTDSPFDKMFKTVVIPKMCEYWRQELEIDKESMSLESMEKIISAIRRQCDNNQFRTHSFNGALEETIRERGLNINQEMFREEFKILGSLSKTPYLTGKLFECELSTASFGYLHKSPERLWMVIGGDGKTVRSQNETDRHFAYRLLDELIKKKSDILDANEVQKIINAGRTIIDFYTKTSKRCMAIRKIESGPYAEIKFERDIITDIDLKMKKIPYVLKKQIPSEYWANFNDIIRDKTCDKKLQKLDQVLELISAVSLDVKIFIDNIKNDCISSVIMRYALTNYYGCYATGYAVEGGKLERDDFALASFPDYSRIDYKNSDELGAKN